MAGPGDGGIGGIGGIGGAPGGIGGPGVGAAGAGGVGGGGGGIGGGDADGPGGIGVGAAAGIGAASASANSDASANMGADIGLSSSSTGMGLSSTNASSASSNAGHSSMGMSPSNSISGMQDPSTNAGTSAIGNVNDAISAAVDAGTISGKTAASATQASIANEVFGALNPSAPALSAQNSVADVFAGMTAVPGMPGTSATPGLSVSPADNSTTIGKTSASPSAAEIAARSSVAPGLSDLSASQISGTIGSIVGNPAANTTGLSPVGNFATNAPSPQSMEAAALSQGLAPAASFGPASSPNAMAAMSVPGSIGMPSEAQAIGVQPGMTMAQAPQTAEKSITARLGIDPASASVSSVDNPQAVTSFPDFPAPPSIPAQALSPSQQAVEDGITNAFGMFGKANDMFGGMLGSRPGSVGGDYKGEGDVIGANEAEQKKKRMADMILHLYPDYLRGLS